MILERFSSEQLAAAFDSVSMAPGGFPTTGDICKEIFDVEFAEDLAFLLSGLKVHKTDWQDIPESRGPSTLGATIDDVIPGRVIPGIRAPSIPKRLLAALSVYGSAGFRSGFDRLAMHPSLGIWKSGDPGSSASFIEREFRAAWLQARKAELGGRL